MRPGPNQKRGRGRGNGRKPSSRSQAVDSNGPSVRIRGNAYQVLEKYLALARDATSAGDRVSAENYFQHAEHYFRIVNASASNNGQNRQQQPTGPGHREQPHVADPRGQPQPGTAVEAADRQAKTNGSSQPEGGKGANGSGPSDGADGPDGPDGPNGSDTDNSQVPV